MAVEASMSGQRFTIAGVVDRMVAAFSGQGWLLFGLAVLFGGLPKLVSVVLTTSALRGVGMTGVGAINARPFALFSTPEYWIALAIACHPALLLADEPTTALDPTIQAQILELIATLSREMNTATILITHNLGIVAGVCDRVAVMYGGRIVEVAPRDPMFADPRHPYTLGLLDCVPRKIAAGRVVCGDKDRYFLSMVGVGLDAQIVYEVNPKIKKATGKPPRGWLGPGLTETWETPDLLKEDGYDYVADWVLDDQPVWLKTRGKPIVNIPYTQECNDVAMMLIQHHKASEYYDRAMDQFEQIYADAEDSARVMALVVHPYIMGAPHRLKYFRKIFENIRKKPDVMFWTGP